MSVMVLPEELPEGRRHGSVVHRVVGRVVDEVPDEETGERGGGRLGPEDPREEEPEQNGQRDADGGSHHESLRIARVLVMDPMHHEVGKVPKVRKLWDDGLAGLEPRDDLVSIPHHNLGGVEEESVQHVFHEGPEEKTSEEE